MAKMMMQASVKFYKKLELS